MLNFMLFKWSNGILSENQSSGLLTILFLSTNQTFVKKCNKTNLSNQRWSRVEVNYLLKINLLKKWSDFSVLLKQKTCYFLIIIINLKTIWDFKKANEHEDEVTLLFDILYKQISCYFLHYFKLEIPKQVACYSLAITMNYWCLYKQLLNSVF